MEEYHRKKGGYGTIFTHPNSHPQDSALIFADSEKRIVRWLNKEDERTLYKNRVNAGIHIISPRLLKDRNLAGKVDLDREVLKPCVPGGGLYVYDSPEYVKDMGTPQRYYEVCDDVAKGKVSARNLGKKQKAVFLDRDGTLNKYCGFVRQASQIELTDAFLSQPS